MRLVALNQPRANWKDGKQQRAQERNLSIMAAGGWPVVTVQRQCAWCQTPQDGTVTAAQCKAARELLGWSRERLAALSGIPPSCISASERTGRMTGQNRLRTGSYRLRAIKAVLTAAGVIFGDADSGYTGWLTTLTPQQCVEARRLLNLSCRQVAKAAGIHHGNVARFERFGTMPKARSGNDRQTILRRSLQQAGIEFVEGDDPAVTLRKAEP